MIEIKVKMNEVLVGLRADVSKEDWAVDAECIFAPFSLPLPSRCSSHFLPTWNESFLASASTPTKTNPNGWCAFL